MESYHYPLLHFSGVSYGWICYRVTFNTFQQFIHIPYLVNVMPTHFAEWILYECENVFHSTKLYSYVAAD